MTDNELKEALKSYLKITWTEEDNDLLKIVERGKNYLNDTSGTALGYLKGSQETQLLLDYGRYVYNHSLELFEINFERELFKLSLREGLKAYASQDTETTT